MSTIEMPVTIYQSTRCNTPEDLKASILTPSLSLGFISILQQLWRKFSDNSILRLCNFPYISNIWIHVQGKIQLNTSRICKIHSTNNQFWVVIQNFRATRHVNSDVMSNVSYTCSVAVSSLPNKHVLHRIYTHPCKQSQYKFHLRQPVMFYIITNSYVNSVETTVY